MPAAGIENEPSTLPSDVVGGVHAAPARCETTKNAAIIAAQENRTILVVDFIAVVAVFIPILSKSKYIAQAIWLQ